VALVHRERRIVEDPDRRRTFAHEAFLVVATSRRRAAHGIEEHHRID
jgi:hypothetical protein